MAEADVVSPDGEAGHRPWSARRSAPAGTRAWHRDDLSFVAEQHGLGEWRANLRGRRMVRQGAPVVTDGERQWQEFAALDISDRDFALLGDEFARDTGLVKAGPVGLARALLMPQRLLVDHAVRWLRDHRGDGAG